MRLTELGRERAGIAQERHAVWANRLAEGMDRSMLATTAEILEELTRRFEADEEQVGQE